MRRFDPDPMDSDVLAELDAIDATLAGEPVDPAYAELAELALLLVDTAPRPDAGFASELDARVARRFEPLAGDAGSGGTRVPRLLRSRRRRLPRWAAGPAIALVAAVAVAVVIVANGGFATGGKNLGAKDSVSLGTARSLGAFTPSTSAASGAAGQPTNNNGAVYSEQLPPVAHMPSTGSKQTQSASISLSTPNQHVGEVAQEVFDVVSAEHGSVQSSQITAATVANGGGYASFTLSIPAASLQAAMTQLSRLHYASVSSRTDGTQNVTSSYSADQRQLKQAQALRTSLLEQLQAATSETAIDSIEAQLKTANAQITKAQNALAALDHRIAYSTVSVQINDGGLPIAVTAHHTNSGLTLGRAGHDALRVLVVAAGVALIALAVLVPLSVLLGLLSWLGFALRRRQRERALG